MYILPDSSWSKRNKTLKFGQLTEYDLRSIFFEKRAQNMIEKLVPELFLKNQIQLYLWVNSLEVHAVFLLYVEVEDYQNILKWRFNLLFLLHIKLFKKTKRRLKLVSLPHIMHGFWRNIFLTLHYINWLNFIVWLPLLLKICQYVYCNCLCSSLWRDKFCNLP